MALLNIKNLQANIEDTPILKGLNLEINAGEIHAIMGPNGSGKSTLSNVIMGNPVYGVTGGEISFENNDVLEMEVDERAKAGIFMAFQYPREITGVGFLEFLRNSYNAIQTAKDEKFEAPSVFKFKKIVKGKMKSLGMKLSFLDRYINEGFSGGEKKKAEMLQLAILEPKLAILDETDSGLDVDALRVVAESINAIKQEKPDTAILIITHYQRILEYITPDAIHVMVDGQIVKSGGKELAHELEETGYKPYLPEEDAPKLKIVN